MLPKFKIRKPLFLAISLAVLGTSYWLYSTHASKAESTKIIKQIIGSEELILSLQKEVSLLSASAMNLKVPDFSTQHLFSSSVRVKGLTGSPTAVATADLVDITENHWPLAEKASAINHQDLKILGPLLDQMSYLESFKAKVVKGHFDDNHFVTKLAFEGLGTANESHSVRSFRGKALARWNKAQETWQINDWEVIDLSFQENPSTPMFRKVTADLITSPKELKQAERCIQDELITSLVKTGGCSPPGPPFRFEFGFESNPSGPAVAVVDINQDGWEDFYLMSRWGKNQLFVSQRGETFRECAAEYGLDILNHCTSAAFADFDNDGDPDLMLGRSYERSMYFLNEGGSFKDVSKLKISFDLPAVVTAVSAVDFNRDGLLDIFLSTYGVDALAREYLSYEEQEKMAKKSSSAEDHPFLNGLGGPNVLLVNIGDGKFANATEGKELELWQTTFQASWSDYDNDGDPDVYICNDFGSDRLFRNDHPNGFTDVTESYGHQSMSGFGMGVAWGDYDLDGLQDIYVSNMYSKAGMRIMEQIPEIDQRFLRLADGNRLYRQTSDGFELTSGFEKTSLQVAKVGWSWGGQFVDFDNNGFLDLYVPSGYFTAPEGTGRGDDL